jgi:NAD(P)-dependent dehydrogenase (short-subunit alcohol dehydrogenase family)
MSVDQRLNGRVAIVTGASHGIGAAISRAFSSAGATVVLAARDEPALHGLAAEIISGSGRALPVVTDVTDPPSVRQLVERTLETCGSLDAAVNNAGDVGHPPTPLADVSIEDYDRACTVSLRGVFLTMKYEIPAMLASGGGAIVNMSSTAGLRAVGGLAGYVSAKFGVVGLTGSAALDYAGRGIRVNALAPGPILTERLQRAGAVAQRQAARALPIQRIGRAEEVAAAAVWLCSSESSFVTGATIQVDGGLLAGTVPFGARPAGEQKQSA